jgi:hypothetical protein
VIGLLAGIEDVTPSSRCHAAAFPTPVNTS